MGTPHILHINFSELCTSPSILPVAPYPNSTRILQHADIAAFKPMKNCWIKCVQEWQSKNPLHVLTKETIAQVLIIIVIDKCRHYKE